MNHPIYDLIQQGEHQQQDFKFCVNDSKKIARSLVAFANTDGGRLLIGVKDNGKIAGVRSEEEFHMIEAAANLYSKPLIPFEHTTWKIEGKIVLEITVEPSDERPHYAPAENGDWKPFVRKGDENLMGNRILAKVWKYDKRPDGDTLVFSDEDIDLFKKLQEKDLFSFNQFCKLSNRHFKKAEHLLIKLISWDIIDIIITEKGCRYQLSSDSDVQDQLY